MRIAEGDSSTLRVPRSAKVCIVFSPVPAKDIAKLPKFDMLEDLMGGERRKGVLIATAVDRFEDLNVFLNLTHAASCNKTCKAADHTM